MIADQINPEKYLDTHGKESTKWISVKDQLPTYGIYVLVFGRDKKMYDIPRVHVCEMNDLEDGFDFNYNGFFYWILECGRRIEEVTHWRPLPSYPEV
jgi:hypothetical protein